MSIPLTLEAGDFFPFINIKLQNGSSYDLMNCTSDKRFLFVTFPNTENIPVKLIKSLENTYQITVVLKEGDSKDTPLKTEPSIRCTSDPQLLKLLDLDRKAYIISPNLRIIKVMSISNLQSSHMDKIDYRETSNIPYLLIENVLDEPLLERILKFYHDNKSKAILHNNPGKNRYHVHPDPELEKAMDNKLSRSLFPEIKKIFYFDVEYRENYKICSYDSSENGRFQSHRDTPHPYGHRRYAMSLCLNDDYEGGEFVLPEYGLSVKLKKNSAFIFPGICSHQVNPITKGSRLTIISFFVTKESEMYRVKSHFFKDRKIEYSKIFPNN